MSKKTSERLIKIMESKSNMSPQENSNKALAQATALELATEPQEVNQATEAASEKETQNDDDLLSCKECGAKLPIDSVFCIKCGNKI